MEIELAIYSISWYFSNFLNSDDDDPEDAIFYSYTRYINGFAAKLDETVAAEIASEKQQIFRFLCFFIVFSIIN